MVRHGLLTPSEVPQYSWRVLGKDDYGEIKGAVDKFVRDTPSSYRDNVNNSLNIFSLSSEGEMTGSNDFAPILILRRTSIGKSSHLITIPELLQIKSNFRGNYEDSGVVYRNKKETHKPNIPLWEELKKQLTKRFSLKNLDNLEYPVALYFSALDTERNGNSAYGLILNLSDEAEIGNNVIINPELDPAYIRENGVFRLCFCGFLGLGSGYEGLAYSGSVGRVVVVSGEATQNLKNLEKYVQEKRKIEEDHLAQLKDLRDEIDRELKTK
ncbi:hypothetical protein AUJ10_01865 [Candidatus Pacearchaeota archaeon CG1_02_31_27]|nr:MAG: hypothetical protein AUJ10_01865 [Candidatus Pacearchaeota archaeon CG1_02_31_27]PIN92584.1 MAG: hypothetical protein COU55_00135 [Candidatus Pacearchaeota archaeon CG10_big_fil_rev_8_21_14_0_10_31_59]PIZ80732.1 MAG: hypothetical protein COX99_01870 [Candidatus Pacearchaeota archaeon CG_4_10_14_0_2_um_filter_31_10]